MKSTIDLSQIEGLATSGKIWTVPVMDWLSRARVEVRLRLSSNGAVTLESDDHNGYRFISHDERYGREWSWLIAEAGGGYGYRVDISALASAILLDSRLRDALASINGPAIHERLDALVEAHVKILD